MIDTTVHHDPNINSLAVMKVKVTWLYVSIIELWRAFLLKLKIETSRFVIFLIFQFLRIKFSFCVQLHDCKETNKLLP